MVVGHEVVASGGPGHVPPTARFRVVYIGVLKTHVPSAGSDAGVKVASRLSSTPTTIRLGARMTQ